MDFLERLPDYSDEQLREAAAAISEELESRVDQRRREAAQEIKRLAAEAGIPLEELTSIGGKGKKGNGEGKRAIVEPKYRNPGNPDETWSGRGRKPKWIEVFLTSGRELSEIRV